MEFENRQPPEGINITRVHPLKQFARLLIAAAVMVVVLVTVLQFSGAWIARKVPFHYELALMEHIDVELGTPAASPQMQQYLESLAQRVGQALQLPEGMHINVTYNNDDVFNAYATVGGNVIFYKGLLSQLPHENALAMVMAHEIAHIEHRDPMAGLGGGVSSMLALAIFTGQGGSGLAGQFLSQAGVVTSTRFTRNMEEAADSAALAAVASMYGHINGAADLFEVMRDYVGENQVPDWLEQFATTHPLSQSRFDAVYEQARQHGWQTEGVITPLPDGFERWLAGIPGPE